MSLEKEEQKCGVDNSTEVGIFTEDIPQFRRRLGHEVQLSSIHAVQSNLHEGAHKSGKKNYCIKFSNKQRGVDGEKTTDSLIFTACD